jgi:hypothetical protein
LFCHSDLPPPSGPRARRLPESLLTQTISLALGHVVHRESKGRRPLSPAAAEPLLPIEVDNNSLLCVLVPVLSKSRHCVCATRGPPAHRMLQSCMTLVYGLNGEDIRIQVPNLDSSIAHRPTGLQGRRTEIHAFELSTEGGWRRASSQAFRVRVVYGSVAALCFVYFM